jgi:ABC-type oligopeptide transport system ATPase subunit
MDKIRMTDNPIVMVNNLTVSFRVENRSFTAVRNVSLDIMKGEVISVVGASGSGKTTLCRAVIGLTKASSGSITISDRPLRYRSRDLRELWRDVQMVFQDP